MPNIPETQGAQPRRRVIIRGNPTFSDRIDLVSQAFKADSAKILAVLGDIEDFLLGDADPPAGKRKVKIIFRDQLTDLGLSSGYADDLIGKLCWQLAQDLSQLPEGPRDPETIISVFLDKLDAHGQPQIRPSLP